MNVDSNQRNLLIAGAALLVALVVGGGAGALATMGIQHFRHVDVERVEFGGPFGPHGPGLPPPPGMPGADVFYRHQGLAFSDELDLSDEQQARVDSLLEEQREKADKLLSDMEPRLKALHDSTNAAIERLLTPDQREEFERIKEERREVIVRSFIEPGAGAKVEILRGPTFEKRILRSDRREER
jgi:Spy/CpxP family protein refolding chaperone